MRSRTKLAVVSVILAGVGAVWPEVVNFPDDVQTRYGIPFQRAFHQSVTIAGPVDWWRVEPLLLLLNSLLWTAVAGLIIGLQMLLRRLRRGSSSAS